MTELPSIAGTITALTLPWLLGFAVLAGLFKTSKRWNYHILVGHGYFVGLFLTTLIIRAWDMIGMPLHFWSIAAATAALAATIYYSIRHRGETAAEHKTPQTLHTWQRIVFWLLVTMIIYRYYGLAQEIWLRPLYPWDAWMNWAPKAVVWFSAGELSIYVSPQEWLANPGDLRIYTTGAENAWKYPVTVPLIQLWGMLGAGASDQNYSNLPWLIAPLTFGLALYGHLRNLGASALMASMACYILLSMPYLSVHAVLAGYADIWLALAFGAAVLSLHEWQATQHWSWGALTLLFAFACTQLKLPGAVMGAIVLIVLMTSAINMGRKAVMISAGMLIALFVYIAWAGLRLDIPAIGQLEISTTRISLPHLGTFNLKYHPVHGALASSLFSLSNWNIFWYVFVAILILKITRLEVLDRPSAEFQCIVLALLFFGFIFYFTHIHRFVLDFTTVNRAILYVIPACVFYTFKYLCTSDDDRQSQWVSR